ncbi:MAG: hypothetical protein ABI333_04820 [bacterium]
MIVPIELQRIALRRGYLSPEIALGWRLGVYLREFFDGLELLRVLAAREDDAALSLRIMAAWQRATPILVEGRRERWDFLVYHPATGTLLGVTRVPERTELPQRVKDLEPALARGDLRAQLDYRDSVQRLVDRLVGSPFEQLCRIDEHRVRRMHSEVASEPSRLVRCRVCGVLAASRRLWELDGVLCCLSCSGLSPQWFDRQ